MANPNTRHVVSQSVSVFANGIKVGSAQSLSPSETLTNAIIRELDSDVAGEIIEIAIGVPSFSVSLTRFKTYQTNMYAALGYVIQNIGDITDPLDLQTVFKSARTGNTVVRTFVDATIESMSDAVNIGTVLVTENANFKVRKVI